MGRSSISGSGPDGRSPAQVKRNTTLSRALAAEKKHSKTRPGHLGDSSMDVSHLAATPVAASPAAKPQGSPAPNASPVAQGAPGASLQAAPQPQPRPPEAPPLPAAQPAPRRSPQQVAPPREEQAAAGRISWVDTRQQPEEPRRGGGSSTGSAGAAQGDPRPQAPAGERRHAAEASPASNAGSASTPLRRAPGAGATLGAGNRRLAPVGKQGLRDQTLSSASTSSPSQARPPSSRAESAPSRSWRNSLTSSLRQASASEGAGAPGEACSQAALRGTELGGSGERLDPRKWGVVDCRTPRKDDPERSHFDLQLLGMLNGRAVSASATARRAAPSTPRPMSAAFTDRSLRKREGLGSRALITEGASEAPADAHKNCCCPVCRPFDLSPAGQASYSVPANLLQSACQGAGAAVQRGTSRGPPDEPTQSRGKSSPNYNSSRMQRIIHYAQESCPASELDESTFQRQLGRKAKPTLSRSLSADPRDPAGGFRKVMSVDLDGSAEERHRIRGGRPDAPGEQSRDEVAMIMVPRTSDPPLPDKITPCKKGHGEHKYGFSSHSERVSLHWNQPLYRYEVAALACGGPRRSASVPPRTGRSEARGWGRLAGEGGDETPRSARGVHRTPRPREGAGAAELTDYEALAVRAARERAERFVADGRFADLCALTEQTHAREGADISAIKERNYHKSSANMASALSWNE